MLRREGTGAGGRRPLARAWRYAAALMAAAMLCAGPARAATEPAPTHLAVALLLDTSGSMAQNDPAGSRVAAARQVLGALGPGDSLGLVGFADTVQVLLPLTAMGTSVGRAAADAALAGVGAAGATDILGAITTGTDLLAGDTHPLDWHVMILITDGVPDLPQLADPAAASRYRARMEAAAQAVAARGWMLDTVGLGSGVDGAELGRLASLGGGQYQFAPSASDLTARLLSEFQAAQRRAAVAPPPKAPAAPPIQVSLRALAVPGIQDPGGAVDLPVVADNSGDAPVAVGIAAGPLPPGWALPPVLTVPPGAHRLTLQATVGSVGGPVRVTVAVVAPGGATLQQPSLTWTLRVRPPWRAFVRAHADALGGVGAGLAFLTLLIGYLGYVLRVRPLRRPRGRLEITAPSGEHLGSVRLPRRNVVLVGAAGAGRRAVRLPWVTGEDLLFRIRVEMEAVHRTAWLAGLCAWVHPPESIVYAEAEWPYHLYPGPRPLRRVDLYDHTAFGAGGLTFTFRSTKGRADGDAAGADLLRALER